MMIGRKMTDLFRKAAEGVTVGKIMAIVAGAMICSFGIHNIHQQTGITEGE